MKDHFYDSKDKRRLNNQGSKLISNIFEKQYLQLPI